MKIPNVYTAAALTLGILTFTGADASAVTNLDQQGGDYVGELDPRGTFDFISLPIDGAVSVKDIEGCEFEGPPRAYGYNGEVYRKNVIHGSRGNLVPLESSCEFNIDKDDIMYSNEPRDINSNEWVIFSPVEQRKVENLEDAVEPCQLNGVNGVPTYQVDMSGNNAKAGGSLKTGKSYWLRLQGQDCAVDFLESTAEDISVQIDTPSEELVTDNTYELTVSADSEAEGMSRIEISGEDITGEIDSKNEGNPCIKQRIVYSCEKTFEYTPDIAGRRALKASVYNLASKEEQERVVLEVDARDEEESVVPGDDTEDESSANGGDTESGNEEESTDGTGELRFELFDAEGDQMNGGNIKIQNVEHSYPKDFSDPFGAIDVPKGQEHEVFVECGDAQLDAKIKLESDAKKIELLLAEPSPGTLCYRYGGGFSERSRAGIFDVRQGDPRPKPVTLGTAEYRFSVVNGGQRIPFEKVPDQVSSFEQDRAYELLFSVKAYRPGTSSTVDVFDGDVKMSVQGPDDATNYNCGGGVSHRCNTPAFAETFDSGDYTVEVTELAGPSGNEIPIEQSKVTLPEVSYGSGYY